MYGLILDEATNSSEPKGLAEIMIPYLSEHSPDLHGFQRVKCLFQARFIRFPNLYFLQLDSRPSY